MAYVVAELLLLVVCVSVSSTLVTRDVFIISRPLFDMSKNTAFFVCCASQKCSYSVLASSTIYKLGRNILVNACGFWGLILSKVWFVLSFSDPTSPGLTGYHH